MNKSDKKILKEIFSQISKMKFSELKSKYKDVYDKKLKIDYKYSHDLNIESRFEREEYITNLNENQLKLFKSVVKSIQDDYLFTEDDIDRLNNFTSRLNYLLKSTSPHNRGMADQMNNIKHGVRINPNAPTFTLKSNSNDPANGNSKSIELEIHKFFNDCIKSNTWDEFKSHSELDLSFFDKSFEWKLVYVFSNIKNCQNKNNYPLFYPAWQTTAEWCFDVEYGNYDAFCEHYRNIDFLDEPKLLNFNCYHYLLRLALRDNASYKKFIDSKEEKDRKNILKELREDEKDELYMSNQNINNPRKMVSNNNFYILSINKLSRIFSFTRAGKEFDFTLSTKESSLSDSSISKDDLLLVTINDEVYYQFNVIDKTEEEIRLKKIFEIEKKIGLPINQEGTIVELEKKEFDSICSKLFDHLVSENIPSVETKNNPNVLIENKSLRQFAFDVFKKLYSEFGEEFLVNELTNTSKSDIGGVEYKAIKFEKYFSSNKMLAIFASKQNKESLTTGKSQRFCEENLKILNEDYIYFNFQWSHPEDSSSANYFELKCFIEDWSNFHYKIDYEKINGKKNYQLILNEPQIDFDINNFKADCESSGLFYSSQLITRFVSSLLTKPFVILTGLSGSGKTKLAQAFAQWICEDKSQYCIVPVGADWTNREPLLGYVNALNNTEYILPENGALELLINANKNQKKPYFLILDEMNLSHVERYFADFLSVMESDDKFKLHSSDTPLLGQGDIVVKNEYGWPKNLFVIGTVNIDETTYMFSPKVLDRANVIEFRISEKEIGEYFESAATLNMSKLCQKDSNIGIGASMSLGFVNKAINKEKIQSKNLNNTLQSFFVELQKVGAEFGYRTASEIQTLLAQINEINPDYKKANKEDEKIDIAIMQKLLPKLHGSRSKLVPILQALAYLCYEVKQKLTKEQMENIFAVVDNDSKTIKYPISLEKITRMHHNAVSNGFTSYAEA